MVLITMGNGTQKDESVTVIKHSLLLLCSGYTNNVLERILVLETNT